MNFDEEAYLKRVSSEEESYRPAHIARGDWLHILDELKTKEGMNGKVRFFGKIVDQAGDPLAGVKVTAEVLRYETSLVELKKGSPGAPRRTFELTSDANGQIKVIEDAGAELVLRGFSLDGYSIVGRKYYVYAFGDDKAEPAYIGDPKNPEIFTMAQ